MGGPPVTDLELAALVQNTPEWLQARCGSVGASDVPDIVRKTKTGPSATRDNLMALKVLERLTGVVSPTYQSLAMRNGHERQPMAISAYEFMTDQRVAPIGIIPHPWIEHAHASPDGLVGDNGLVEVKCPQPAAHLQALLTEKVERDYQVQVQWQMACGDRDWCDFVSWNPDFPPAMQLWFCRLQRDESWIDELVDEVVKFLLELDHKVAALKAHYNMLEAAA